MPVLVVELTGGVAGALRQGLAQRLADAAGAVFQSNPGQTWVRIHDTLPGDYAENAADASSDGIHPVFVRVMKHALPEGSLLVEEVRALTEAVALATGRPFDQVHVAYDPPGAGRVAFGGRIVR